MALAGLGGSVIDSLRIHDSQGAKESLLVLELSILICNV